MSIRQIQNYLGRIKKDDPNRSYFIETIIPSLKSIKDINQSQKFNCPVCVNAKLVNREKVSFTNYYTYIRHLQEQHCDVLPCNGEVFSSEYDPESSHDTRLSKRSKDVKHYKCKLCETAFSRKEHYKNHLESKRHKRKEIETNTEEDKRVLNEENKENNEMIIESKLTKKVSITKLADKYMIDDYDNDYIPSYQQVKRDISITEFQFEAEAQSSLTHCDNSDKLISPRKNIEAMSEKLKEIENNNKNVNLKRQNFDDNDEDDMLLLEHLNYFESNFKKQKHH